MATATVWRDTAPPTVTRNWQKTKEGRPPHFGSRLGARAPRPRACGAGGRRAGAHGAPRGGSRVPPPFFPGGGVPGPPRPPAPARGASAVGRGRYPPIAVWADRGGGAARAGRGPREPPRPQPTPVLRPGGSALTGLGPALTLGAPCSLDGRTDGLTDCARAFGVCLRWPSGGGLVGHDASGHDRHRPLPAGAQIPAVRLLLLHPPRRPRAARPRDGGSWPPRRPGPAPRRRPDETSRQQPTHTRRTPISGRRTTARAPPRTSPPPTSSSTCSTTS